jgi:hypothetical protein
MVEETNQPTVKRVCSRCGSTKTLERKGKIRKDSTSGNSTEYWVLDKEKDGHMCNRCYMKYVINPKLRPLWDNRFYFKGKTKYASKRPRIGVCNFCRAVVGQINAQMDNKLCKRTNLAHLAYHEDDPLKDTLEACVSCHCIYDNSIQYIDRVGARSRQWRQQIRQ